MRFAYSENLINVVDQLVARKRGGKPPQGCLKYSSSWPHLHTIHTAGTVQVPQVRLDNIVMYTGGKTFKGLYRSRGGC